MGTHIEPASSPGDTALLGPRREAAATHTSSFLWRVDHRRTNRSERRAANLFERAWADVDADGLLGAINLKRLATLALTRSASGAWKVNRLTDPPAARHKRPVPAKTHRQPTLRPPHRPTAAAVHDQQPTPPNIAASQRPQTAVRHQPPWRVRVPRARWPVGCAARRAVDAMFDGLAHEP